MPEVNLGQLLFGKLWGKSVIPPQHKKKDGTWVETGEDEPMPTTLTGSIVAQPVDVQARYSKTIQTHSGVTLAPSAGNIGAWIDCEGFNELAITLMNDATASSYVNVHWSNDNANAHGEDSQVMQGTSRYKSGNIAVKARYARFLVYNSDATPHSMSVWAYLKA